MIARRFILAVLLAPLTLAATAGEPAIDARLDEELKAAGPRELLSVVAIFTDQVPPETVARLAREPGARSKIQARLRSLAADRRLALDKSEWAVANVRPLWIVNAVALEATPAVIRELAARPDVARVRLVARGDAFLSAPRGTTPITPRSMTLNTPRGTATDSEMNCAPHRRDSLTAPGQTSAHVKPLVRSSEYAEPTVRPSEPAEPSSRPSFLMGSSARASGLVSPPVRPPLGAPARLPVSALPRPPGRGDVGALPGGASGIVLPPERRDWGAVLTGAFRAHRELGLIGDGVVVAVVDSGVCWRHPGIAGRVWVNPGEDLDGDGEVMDPDDANGLDDDGNGFVDDLVGWDFDDGDNDPDDVASGHGSHVAGSVAGDGGGGFAAGTAPGASVMIVRVGQFSSDEVDAWRGIEYALASGADVINLSMGWPHGWRPERATWRRLVDTVTAMGVPFVVAAGNEGWVAPPDSVRTPADVPSAIAVGSTDRGDAISDESSIGPVTWQDVPEYGDFPLPAGKLKPELSAPGVEIESHARCAETTIDTGTSMAAPHVAGAVALLLEADPSLAPGDVLEILAETATDLGEPGPDPVFGHGRIDVFAAASRANRGLRQDGVRVEDDELGNGSGALDPGETARLVVALSNADQERAVAGLDARLVSETPGLVVIESAARYGAIAPGSSAEPVAGDFVVRSDLPCAARARLRLELVHEDGGVSRTRVELRSGRETPARLARETFESDTGWTSGGDAVAGAWERAVPDGARLGRTLASPRRDTADRGRLAFVTGAGGGSARDGDVDGGEARLTSPAFDASEYTHLAVSYARWFFREPDDSDSERLVVEASDDDGRSWVPIDELTAGEGGWVRVRRPLGAYVALTGTLRLRVRAIDPADEGPDGVVEAALDDLRLDGLRLVCDPL